MSDTAEHTFEPVSFTAMSGELNLTTISRLRELLASEPHQYKLELNYSDMVNLMVALSAVHSGRTADEETQDWAADMVSSIAATVNVESV